MSTISRIHTPCKSCVFAIYDNNTQTGCHLDYINKYTNIGSEILEVYDDEKEFYVINDKKCIGYRENKWFNQYNLQDSTIEEKIKKFRELNRIEYLLVVDMKNFNETDLDNIKNNINQCSIAPKKIIFIRHQNSDDCCRYDRVKGVLSDLHKSCGWRIQTMLDNDISYEAILHNIVNMNKGYRFIVTTGKNSESMPKIIEAANETIYNQLGVVTAMSDSSKSAVLFSAPSYRYSAVVERKNILSDETNYIII